MNVNENEPAKASVPLAVTAFAMVFFVFLGDWYAPAIIAVGLAYEVPVVLAGLSGTRRLTLQVLALGLVGLLMGWFMDFAADSYHLSAERIENRLLSIASLLIVGSLVLMVRRQAERAVARST